MLRKNLLAAAAVFGMLISAETAQASIIATLNSISNSSSHTGAFDFSYSATLAADEQITTGSYLTLYDWGAALQPLPTSATGLMANSFTFTQQMVGPTPFLITPTDNASVLNVVATYNGAAVVNGVSLGNGASGNLGTFVLTSPLGGSNPLGLQASSAQHYNPGDSTLSGSFDSNVTTSTKPAAMSIPEPASLTLLGGALALIGIVRRRRQVRTRTHDGAARCEWRRV